MIDIRGTKDIHPGISWGSFLTLIEEYGFERGYGKTFLGYSSRAGVQLREEEVIYFHREKGLILFAESYKGEMFNSAIVYGELIVKSDVLTKEQLSALFNCSSSFCNLKNGRFEFSLDASKGLLFNLNIISKKFKLPKKWSKVPSLSFVNYMEIGTQDCQKISTGKIQQADKEVSMIIYG